MYLKYVVKCFQQCITSNKIKDEVDFIICIFIMHIETKARSGSRYMQGSGFSKNI